MRSGVSDPFGVDFKEETAEFFAGWFNNPFVASRAGIWGNFYKCFE
jgi:hypothetical protein